MKKSLIILAVLGLTSSIFASECSINSSSLQWTAFKTPAKVGVKGTFDNIDLKSKTSSTQEKLLSSSSVKIDTFKVNTKHQQRDKTLVDDFFKIQGVKTIDAKVVALTKDSADVEILMNGVSKIVPMKTTFAKDGIKLNGVIDLADFKMLESLSAINKSCFDLHSGKTWQDVTLEFSIKTTCK